MDTSRSALDRLLDPKNIAVTLKTMDRATTVLGKRLRIELVDVNTDQTPIITNSEQSNPASTIPMSSLPA